MILLLIRLKTKISQQIILFDIITKIDDLKV